MELRLDIKSELPTAVRWTDTMTKQLPFAISQALNKVGFDARDALKGASRQVFDNPTPFIQNAWRVDRSNKRNLEVIVYPEAKRVPYLLRNIVGGARGLKPFEVRLSSQASDPLPNRSKLVPAAGVRLNAQGNVSLATIKKISSQVATYGRNSVFIGTPRGGSRPPGVYRRVQGNRKLLPLFLAVPRASYKPIFPIKQIGTKVAERRFGEYLRSSLEQALATAR